MRGTTFVGVVAALVGAAAACADLDALVEGPPVSDAAAGVDVVTTDDGATIEAGTDAAEEDASADVSVSGCASPRMITIPDAGYCIERTEVSRAQYAEFVAAMRIDAGALVPLQKAVAAASPEAACPQYFAASQLASRIDGGADVPVTAIDWCAAFMYCAWRGARLCGGRADGGLYRSSYIGDPQKEEWLHACTQAGHLAYPYGSTAKPVCETKDNGGLEAGLAPVGSHAECQGGYPGVFDMVGNAWEWQHSYSPPDASFRYYEARGASYTDDQPGCQGDWGVGPEGNELIGFRCCASAP